MSDREIVIEWLAVPNRNQQSGGFLPLTRINGRSQGHLYGPGESKDDAERSARNDAMILASRYVGDWSVTIRRGTADMIRRATAAGVPVKVISNKEGT